jgi:hypothetical protein
VRNETKAQRSLGFHWVGGRALPAKVSPRRVGTACSVRYRFGVPGLAIGRAALLMTSALCALACATQRELIDRSAGAGVSPCSFWPPPPSTSVALTRNALPAQAGGLTGVANRIATELDAAGYPEPRWYPIGLEYRHGFAATRLEAVEAVNDDATPKPQAERWSSLYPDAANLRWLTLARKMPLPRPGRYRVFLIAVTDLPLGSSAIAPIWNEDTVMDGPGVGPKERSPRALGGSRELSGYRLGVYLYQYERQQNQVQGQSSAGETEWSATAQLHAAGLARLVESPFDARNVRQLREQF